MEILRVNNLKTYFKTTHGTVKAVDGVSFSLNRGETLGIVGESGVGKSVTAHTVMGLARNIGAGIVDGEVWYEGKDLFADHGLYGQVRGAKIALIPQEAGTALNPVMTVGDQLGEVLSVHLALSGSEKQQRIVQLLGLVELPNPSQTARLYPFQLSGGALQRVLLAIALSCGPEIIIADEPASSLDTTIQAQILGTIRDIKRKSELSMILIAHDLGVISQNCDRLLVMYGGRVMESGLTSEILRQPLHPYTIELLEIYRCLDEGDLGCDFNKGYLPSSYEDVPGCAFAGRCRQARDRCRTERPAPLIINDNRTVSCHFLSA